jgi:hypothetical protein
MTAGLMNDATATVDANIRHAQGIQDAGGVAVGDYLTARDWHPHEVARVIYVYESDNPVYSYAKCVFYDHSGLKRRLDNVYYERVAEIYKERPYPLDYCIHDVDSYTAYGKLTVFWPPATIDNTCYCYRSRLPYT